MQFVGLLAPNSFCFCYGALSQVGALKKEVEKLKEEVEKLKNI